jgi:hypothetical protein
VADFQNSECETRGLGDEYITRRYVIVEGQRRNSARDAKLGIAAERRGKR